MNKRKVKVEMSDENDNKVTITFEGTLDEKSLKAVVDSANKILGKDSTNSGNIKEDIPIEDALELPLYERVRLLISTAFGMGSWFTTNDLCESYQDLFSDLLKTTTASTYLARLHDEGYLERTGSRTGRKYKLKKELREKTPKLISQ